MPLILSDSLVLTLLLTGVVWFLTLLAVPFLVTDLGCELALEGAGRFFPITGAGVGKGSVEDAREAVTDGSVFKVGATVGGTGGTLEGRDGGEDVVGGSSGIEDGSTGILVAGSTMISRAFSGSKV